MGKRIYPLLVKNPPLLIHPHKVGGIFSDATSQTPIQASAGGLPCHRSGAPKRPDADGRTPASVWLDPRGCRMGGGPLESYLARGSRRQRTGHPRHEHHHAFRRPTGKTESGDRRGQAATGHPQAQKNDPDHANHAQAHATATDEGLTHRLSPHFEDAWPFDARQELGAARSPSHRRLACTRRGTGRFGGIGSLGMRLPG